jgi:tetratricopeptide (TPR) repeat protein
LVHLDLKPSNVLLAADGQPMLLDFHLARAPLPAGAPAPAWLGGTPQYMAPEQRAALAAVQQRGQVQTAVDGRADVFALGLLLYEALGGSLSLREREAAPSLRRHNPQVSAGLAALVAKCLADDPSRRYPSATAVAADLRRHLDDFPLHGVADRNVAERWRKWRRRRPLALPVFGLLATAVVTGTWSLHHAVRQSEQARAALQAGEEYVQRRQYAEAAEVFRHGETLAGALPFGDLSDRLRERRRLAERGLAARELHEWCERLRPLYGAELLQKEQALAVLNHCRTFWDRRRLIAEQLAEQPAPDLEQQVRADLLDLVILWAELRVRFAAPGDAKPARDEALAVLDEAESLFGRSCVLTVERLARTRALSNPNETALEPAPRELVPEPRNAWEHFALGRAYFRAGEVSKAEAEMDRALQLDPGALWPNFWKGNCAFRLKRFDDAVTAFSVCVALAPRSAWCYSNRGLAFAQLDRLDRAAEDFERALQLEPTLAAAVRGRGLLHHRARRYSEALADLRCALDLGAEPATVYADLALVRLAVGERTEALACVRRALAHDPSHPHARELFERFGQRGPVPGSFGPNRPVK